MANLLSESRVGLGDLHGMDAQSQRQSNHFGHCEIVDRASVPRLLVKKDRFLAEVQICADENSCVVFEFQLYSVDTSPAHGHTLQSLPTNAS